MNIAAAFFYLALMFFIAIITPSQGVAGEKEGLSKDIEALISGIVNAYGGKEVIKRTKAVYAKGEIKAIMRMDEGTYVRYFMRGRKLRVETTYSRSLERRVLNGELGWRSTEESVYHEVTGIRYSSMVYQYKQLDLPYGLLTNAYDVRDEGRGVLNGVEVRVLGLTDKEGPPMKVYIDPESCYVIKVTGTFRVAEATTDLSAEFSDFRIVDGVPFPFTVTNYAGGRKIAETHMTEYAINPEMDMSLFR